MKFSIVTPAYNMQEWIAETIDTVLSQEGDFEIEYIVMDDESKDGTRAVAEAYAERVKRGAYQLRCRGATMEVVSQENTGMYEAVNRGFARATGDVYAWINADDLYHPGAFETMRRVFEQHPHVEWVKGITDTLNEDGTQRTGVMKLYRQDWLAAGVYGQESYFVEQDSVFWRAALWKKVAPMPAHYRSAADYWLWIQMAKHASLWSVNARISLFRKREGQISKDITKYKKEQWEARPHRPIRAWPPRLFFSPWSRLGLRFHRLFVRLYPFVFPLCNASYFEVTADGTAVKKPFTSFIQASV